jgi:hypothetical protein
LPTPIVKITAAWTSEHSIPLTGRNTSHIDPKSHRAIINSMSHLLKIKKYSSNEELFTVQFQYKSFAHEYIVRLISSYVLVAPFIILGMREAEKSDILFLKAIHDNKRCWRVEAYDQFLDEQSYPQKTVHTAENIALWLTDFKFSPLYLPPKPLSAGLFEDPPHCGDPFYREREDRICSL